MATVHSATDFLAMLRPPTVPTSPHASVREFIVVPEDMSLERAVAAGIQTGQHVVVKPGEYNLSATLCVPGRLNLRADANGAGGEVRILGTCVFTGPHASGGTGGHVKGIAFVGYGGDCIRVEGGVWSFHNCSFECTLSPVRLSSSALWVSCGKVSLFACTVGQAATNGIVACGNAAVEADMCKISGAIFGVGCADSALLELKGCDVFGNSSAFSAGARPFNSSLRVLDCTVHDNKTIWWNDKFRPQQVKSARNTGF